MTSKICSERSLIVISTLTTFFEAIAITSLYMVNISNHLETDNILPTGYQKNISNLNEKQKIIYYLCIAFSSLFFIGLFKLFNRLNAKTYQVEFKEYHCWTEKKCGIMLDIALSFFPSIYRATTMSYISSEITSSLTGFRSIGFSIGSILFIGSSVSQYALFDVSSKNKNYKYNLLCKSDKNKTMVNNRKNNLYTYALFIHIFSSLHSINNTILYLNSCRIIINEYISKNIEINPSKNNISDNIILTISLLFLGFPCYNIMKITYKNLIKQLFNIEKIEKICPKIKCKIKYFPNEENKQTVKYYKLYVSLIKALATAVSINNIISSYIKTGNNVEKRVYIAGIPTILGFYACLVSRISLYFKSKHQPKNENNTNLLLSQKYKNNYLIKESNNSIILNKVDPLPIGETKSINKTP